MEEYEANRQARLEHDKEWWGDRHAEPEKGDPDRQHIYAHNPPISNQEVQEALKAYRESIKNPETGVHDTQSVHLRPSTPPIEKAKRQLRVLKEQGVNVTLDLAKEVISHYTTNNGMVAALTEWCQNELHVPVEYANELLKGSDRLKLEMATQQRDLQYELDQTKEYLKDAREDAQKMTVFHDTAFGKVKKHKVAWFRNKGIYDGLSGDDERASAQLQTLLNETTEYWRELDRMYDTDWPPTMEALEQGGNTGDMGLLSALEQRGRELKDKGNEIEELKRKLEEKEQVVEKLKLKLHETSSLSSSEVSGEDTSEHRRVSSVTSMAPSFNSIQMEEEMKRLKQENSDLQQKLADTSKQNESKLQEASEETRNLRARVQTQKEDIKQLNNRIREKDREFTKNSNNIRQEGNLYRNRLKVFEVVQFRTADSLIAAIGKNDTPSYIQQKISLKDRINYLHLLFFIRIQNSIKLALLLNEKRMFESLLKDMKDWAEFCHKDFETMDPSVNIQIGTSIRVVDAITIVLTKKTEEEVKEALEIIRDGLDVFEQYNIELAFSQLYLHAQEIWERSEGGEGINSYTKRLRISIPGKRHLVEIARTPSKTQIRATLGKNLDRKRGRGKNFKDKDQDESQDEGQI
ncbi:hypothetical protein FVEN_g8572 [Fusarium venenatum]|uniref:Uncharacterized protein n=1 Tax=Fusarium venenatum TaxID=56646 RepID=A0A2L2T7R4_9HYPO|nr:uncharacterized protein FVRRES_03436 [Fusarium venenatum]KAG8353498.1 hypothetical protein FVEN_g8572 [Fusarium venenatum]CEI66924.1 unnamed protein product [Fusarium venenatum]